MKRVKMWVYLFMVVGMGIVYLSCVDHWQVYAETVQQAREWYQANGAGQSGMDKVVQPAADTDEGKQNSPDDAAEGSSAVGDGQRTDESMTGGDGGDVSLLTCEEEGDSGSGDTGTGDGSGSGDTGTGDGSGSGDTGTGDGSGSGDTGTGDGSGSGNTGTGVGSSGENSDEGGHSGNENGGSADGGNPGGGETEDNRQNAEPVYMTVEDDYFSDAVFIGDSRTVGMFEYGGLEDIATFYATKGLTIFELFDTEIVSVPGSKKKITVEEALKQNTFGKIYLMIGINEMGGVIERYLEEYEETIERLKELQPDAIIYIQAIIKVTTKRSEQGDYITNEGIEERNEAISRFADNERVFYLDVNPLICDETGGMDTNYTFDGVHLKAQYIDIWKDFLKSHTICLDDQGAED